MTSRNVPVEVVYVERDIERITDALRSLRADGSPLAEACVASLESAGFIAHILRRQLDGKSISDELFQEALSASRASTEAIRFAIVESSDTSRREGDSKLHPRDIHPNSTKVTE